MIPPKGVVLADKKQGANSVEGNQIRHLAAAGHDAAFISDAMMIELACVESYVADFNDNREHYEALWAGAGLELPSQATSHNQPGGEQMDAYFEKKAADQKKQETLLD